MATVSNIEILADPVGFTAAILGHHIWRIPAQILESLAKNRHTAVKSCHASGKTFTAAEAVIWWITRWGDGIAITTAPTWLQVKKLLWGEIRKTLPAARIEYPKLAPSATELKLGEGNYALGLSTNEGVNFQGFHSPHILMVLDEAPGVEGVVQPGRVLLRRATADPAATKRYPAPTPVGFANRRHLRRRLAPRANHQANVLSRELRQRHIDYRLWRRLQSAGALVTNHAHDPRVH